MKRIPIVILGLVLLAALSGCNTIHGAGEDIERGGEAVQEAAS